MTALALYPTDMRRRAPLPAFRTGETVLTELCAELFASLPRIDQRHKGAIYIRGLLAAQGRKSIRKLAMLSDGQVSEQSLHHFVCSSTWDWNPIRETLAQYVARAMPVHAWVVRPMVTPKAGEHSVGVHRRFSADVGHMLNAQQAIGVWAASDQLSCPVNWRLHLSRDWLEDTTRRSRVAIPDNAEVETLGDCAVAAYLRTAQFWGLPVRPVVMDARQVDTLSAVRRLRASGLPMLIRVNNNLPLLPACAVLPGRITMPLPAQQIMSAAQDLRRPVFTPDTGLPTGLAAVVAVRLPSTGVGRELSLLGEWEYNHTTPSALWLTDMITASPAALVRLSRLIHKVDEDFEQITDQVGARDYSGRSFNGWHRHITLASAAHVVVSCRGGAGRKLRYVS